MTETSMFWDGVSIGDASAAPYDAPNEFASVLRSLAGAGCIPTNLGGVFRGELNQLQVTAPGSVSPAVVATGRALAYGEWYQNDATVNVVVPTPSGSTRIDRIVLRKSWAAQTVRITRIAGVEGGGAPALVQIAGATWDTPVAQVSITTGAAVTVTDEREYIQSRQIAIIKTVSQTVNNDITLQADTVFKWPVGAFQKWIVRHFLKTSGLTASGIKMAWDLPAGASYIITGIALASGAATVTDTDTDNPITLTGADYPIAIVDSVLQIDGTGGIAQFQWAQASATVVDSKVLAGSDMIASQA